MGGGLLNLVAYGNLNVIVNGNPSKTFFKTTYAKYTNFGLQKFRIDYSGLRNLRLNEESIFTFRIPRYADLLMDTFISVTLPNIWSPVLNEQTDQATPYEFKWIDNIGAQLIKKIKITVGGQIIQEFSGQYLLNMVKRDFTEDKKKMFNELIGNGNTVYGSELTNPAFFGGNASNRTGNNGRYPNARYVPENEGGPQPSITSQTIYIPINIWSTLSSKMAFPLVSLQYNILQIEVECRAITDLFVIRDVLNPIPNNMMNRGKYIRADQNIPAYQFYRFIQPPPSSTITENDNDIYVDKRTDWFADIHLVSTYAFLSDDEVRVFAAKPQKYLIREVHEYDYNNVTGNQRTKIYSLGLVASWMWFFQRDDIITRNEWSNYTNWEYSSLDTLELLNNEDRENPPIDENILRTNLETPLYSYGSFKPQNQRDIMLTWGLLFDGKYRENPFPAPVYGRLEKYIRNNAYSISNLYCYNFSLDTNPFNFQPSGAVNLSKFSVIEFEYSTYPPPADANAQTLVVCDGDANPIGVNKPMWRLYDYNYNLHLMEERYNILIFESGNAGLMFSR